MDQNNQDMVVVVTMQHSCGVVQFLPLVQVALNKILQLKVGGRLVVVLKVLDILELGLRVEMVQEYSFSKVPIMEEVEVEDMLVDGVVKMVQLVEVVVLLLFKKMVML